MFVVLEYQLTVFETTRCLYGPLGLFPSEENKLSIKNCWGQLVHAKVICSLGTSEPCPWKVAYKFFFVKFIVHSDKQNSLCQGNLLAHNSLKTNNIFYIAHWCLELF